LCEILCGGCSFTSGNPGRNILRFTMTSPCS
jgi:hypothetical protein